MSLLRPIAFTLSLSLFAACGDDSTATDTATPDTTTDTASDTSPDGNDVTPDTAPDSTPDTATDTSTPDGNDVTPDTIPENTATVAISAATGGEVTLGDATLSIPARALAADTIITVAAAAPTANLPDTTTLEGMTYDFGPDGTTFLVPVTLALPLVGTPGAGETAVISWLDANTGAWVDVASTVTGGEVRAEIEHFTVFVVRFVTAGTDSCGFTPCGAEGIVGTWGIDGLCVDQVFDNPFGSIPDCASSVFEIIAGAEGDITFNGDNTYLFAFEFSATINAALNGACMTALGGMSCAALGTQMTNEDLSVTCSDAADGCTCSGSGLGNSESGSGTWSVSGDELTLNETGAEPDTSKICITGDTATVQNSDVDEQDGSITTSTLSLSRK